MLADENVDFQVVSDLRVGGHDTTWVIADYRPGMSDEEVLAAAHYERRTLLTHDTDFGDLIFRRHLQHAGVVLVRCRVRARKP